LFVWGAFQGALDVAMNTQGITVERASHRMLMPGLHGSWSIGSFAGAGIGALTVGAGITPSPQLLVLGTLALLAAGLFTVRMLPDAADRHSTTGMLHDADKQAPPASRAASRWSGGMLLLGAIAFASMLALGLLPVLTAFIVIGTSTARPLKPRHYGGRPAVDHAQRSSR
jgi:hypothetical protein